MPTYLLLTNWTDQGIRAVKQSPDRVRRAEELFEQLGAKLTAFYLTMGAYDQAAIVEAPDDETMARVALTLGSQGNVRTTTLKAFPRDEFEKLVRSLG
ncbi:MAG TPA: GYD domain-containing protein [Chloroflexota bacterium]|nr:GYD domain-containing protein [Chloroflexota bacterium]